MKTVLTADEIQKARDSMSRRTSAKKKAPTFGEDLIQGMKQVLAHQSGEVELEQVWPKPVDVKAIR